MKSISCLILVAVIILLIDNVLSAPVDPKKSTVKPSDANEVGDSGSVSLLASVTFFLLFVLYLKPTLANFIC